MALCNATQNLAKYFTNLQNDTDIYNYLINTPSEYSYIATREMLKAYKSTDSYNLFVNGWVSKSIVTLRPALPLHSHS